MILLFIISAFIFPRLYISNKDLIDARLHQGQAILNSQFQRTQEFASAKLTTAKKATQTYVDKTKTAVESKTSTTSNAGTFTTSVPSQKLD